MNLMTALYFDIMNVNPEDPKMPDRVRFVLSKGHCVEALYTVLEAR
jgi:transketolase